MKEAIKVYNSNRGVKRGTQSVAYGLSIGAATEFIAWIMSLFGLTIPIVAAGFLAGCLVPIVQHYLNKLET